MFDPRTVQLISASPKLRSAPDQELSAVDPGTLARELTQAFSEIASIRLSVRDTENIDNKTSRQLLSRRLHRIANTFEAIVCIGKGSINQSAAFVAGIARQLAFDIHPATAGRPRNTYLSVNSISSDVSAMLLFIAAEAHADAKSSADRLEQVNDTLVRNQLLFLLRCLGRSEFDAIVTWSDTVGLPAITQEAELADQAVDTLYNELSAGIVVFAREMMGLAEPGASEQIYRKVSSKAAKYTEISGERTIGFLLGGPHHLSKLLLSATSSLGQLSLLRTPPPSGVDDLEAWSKALKSLALKRPLVWRNHRGALDGGLLDHGVSAVMNFPTGSGKTTLAVLKILSCHHGKGRTIYLAPTHALCDQIRTDLINDLGQGISIIVGEHDGDLDFHLAPDVIVMTPEQSLASLAFNQDAFTGVGLLVFDECHLLHPSKAGRSRRSLDAMLALLAFTEAVPDADVLLLSAMIKNADELAAWISSIKQGQCYSFEDTWRPTRQARAVVVYDKDQISQIRRDSQNLDADPYALFQLQRNWNPLDRDGFTIKRIVPKPVPLKRNGRSLGSNRNVLAAEIAVASQSNDPFRSPKVLIFAENKIWVKSIRDKFVSSVAQPLSPPSQEESVLYRMVRAELGPAATLINALDASAVIHHGDLLPLERKLAESLFRRKGGPNCMVATSTLAQGLNLPCELVILAGTDRFDEGVDGASRENIPAHEMLNALGRAGRAGSSAAGISIVIPGNIIKTNFKSFRELRSDTTIPTIFSENDNCLKVDDPLSVILLDKLDTDISSSDPEFQHALRRLRLSFTQANAGEIGSTLFRSLSAYRAIALGDTTWLKTRVDKAVQLVEAVGDPSDVGWRDRLSANTGLTVQFISEIEREIVSHKQISVHTIRDVLEYVIMIAIKPKGFIYGIFREQTIKKITSLDRGRIDDDILQDIAVEMIRIAFVDWITGLELINIEKKLHTAQVRCRALGNLRSNRMSPECNICRKFLINVVPDLAFACSVVSQIIKGIEADMPIADTMVNYIKIANAGLRSGFDTIEGIALGRIYDKQLCRVEVHKAEAILLGSYPYIPVSLSSDIGDVVRNIRSIILSSGGLDTIAQRAVD